MEHIIAGYLRQVWNRNEWLYDGQHGFRLGYSCENQVVTVCQEFTDSLDGGAMVDAIIIDFPKAFSLVPLAYGNDIWRNIESAERLQTDDSITYRKIVGGRDIENLQTDLDCLGAGQ